MSFESLSSGSADPAEGHAHGAGARAPAAGPADAYLAIDAGKSLGRGLEDAMRLLAGVGAERAVVYFADPKQRSVTVEATYGVSAEGVRPRFGLGVAGRVCDCGRPIVVPRVREEPMALFDLADAAAWQGSRLSLVCVPIADQGRCRGALAVYFERDAGTFTEWVAAAQAMAVAIARTFPLRRAAPEAVVPPSDRVVRSAFEYANMIGTSAVMRRVYEEIGQVARTMATALILGESGTGKELVAQAIHDNSDRAGRPFIKVNSAAFPETLFESELFGHERGAFTGAVSRKKGRIDWAQGGTLFLDEIGELPLSTQVKLLRVLQSREYERLGGTETLKADVRLVAATNKNMAAAVANGTFREDLYYRLNVFTVVLPPLRERAGDIAALAEFFLEKYAREHRRKVRRIASSALDVLARYAWPGNVRELENAIERAVVVCTDLVLEERHLPHAIRSAAPIADAEHLTLGQAVERLERRMIEDALQEAVGNLARASRALGTTERILRYKVRKYGITPRS